jgi:hypothetical protein
MALLSHFQTSHNVHFATQKSRLVKMTSNAFVCYHMFMTKLMEQVIELLRQIPEREQDELAADLVELLEEYPTQDELTDIKEGEEALARGEFITLEQWRHEMGFDTK